MAKEEKKQKYAVVEIATQTAPVILDNETEERHTIETALAKILNKLEELNKAMVG